MPWLQRESRRERKCKRERGRIERDWRMRVGECVRYGGERDRKREEEK